MKKQVAAGMLAAMLLTGCAGNDTFSRADHTPPESSAVNTESEHRGMPEAPQVPGVFAEAEEYINPADISVIRLRVTNENDESFFLPERFEMKYIQEVEEDYEWEYIPYREGGDYFRAEAQEIPAHSEAEAVLNLGEHFALPLDGSNSGFYRIEIGGISADFMVDPALPKPEPPQSIYLDTESSEYPSLWDEVNVRIINDGTEDFTYSPGDLAIEYFAEGSVAVYYMAKENPEAQKTVTVAPGSSEMLTLKIEDYPGLRLNPGKYAVYLSGLEAPFSVIVMMN